MLGVIRMLDRQTVVEKVSKSADRYGAENQQQFEQLLSAFKEVSDRELFFGLFCFSMSQVFEKALLIGNS